MKNHIRADQVLLTDLTPAHLERILPLVQRALSPAMRRKLSGERLVWYLQAIAYISRVGCGWSRIPRIFPAPPSVYRLNYQLRKSRILPAIREILGPDTPFVIDRRKRRLDVHQPRRKCGPCPKCGQNAMICYKTRKQGSRVLRYYQCAQCGARRLWLESPQKQNWLGELINRQTGACCA